MTFSSSLPPVSPVAPHEDHSNGDEGPRGTYRAGQVDVTKLDLASIVTAMNPGSSTIRWNFDKNVGLTPGDMSTVGTGITLQYTFVAGPSDYHSADVAQATGWRPFTEGEKAEVREALAAYSEVANIQFVETTNVAPGSKTMVFGQFNLPASLAGLAYSPAWGYSMNWPVRPDTIEAVTVADFAGDVFIDQSNQDRPLTLRHEIGHALGLQHPFEGAVQLPSAAQIDGYTVMGYADTANSRILRLNGVGGTDLLPTALNLGLLDVAAVQYLYGANMTTRAGDTIYQFDELKPVRQTIWDAGGEDVIDLSAHTTLSSKVDLVPGAFSSIGIRDTHAQRLLGVSADPNVDTSTWYDGRSNVAIAIGAVIEHAKGGSRSDTLAGNHVANRLEGNGGNDILSGRAGNDTLDGGAGSDILIGGVGDDIVRGGVGIDAVVYLDASGIVGREAQVIDGQAGFRITTAQEGTDWVVGVEALVVGNRSFFFYPAKRYSDLGIDEQRYLLDNPDVAAAVRAGSFKSGADHYAQFGRAEGRGTIVDWFDEKFYLASNPDVAAAGVDPGTHFRQAGQAEGRAGNLLWDPQFYLATNADVAAAGLDPWTHYLQYGWREGRDPSILFDSESYLIAHQDIALAGVNPFIHYLDYGQFEGRATFASSHLMDWIGL